MTVNQRIGIALLALTAVAVVTAAVVVPPSAAAQAGASMSMPVTWAAP